MWELYRDIVAPNSPTLVRMGARGAAFDEALRISEREVTKGRIAVLEARVAAEAQAFHAARLTRLTRDAVLRCTIHPRYEGWTKTKRKEPCQECSKVYMSAVGLRKARVLGPVFKPGSSDHWRALLFEPEPEGFGLESLARTPKRHQPQVNDETIEELQAIYPEVTLLACRVERQHLQRRLGVVLAVPTVELG